MFFALSERAISNEKLECFGLINATTGGKYSTAALAANFIQYGLG
jgi:hypothetical protein